MAEVAAKNSSMGLASLVPLNARAFLRNIMRKEGDTSSLLTAEDFTPEQIELIYEQVDRGRAGNEQGLIQADSYKDRIEERRKEQERKGEMLFRDPSFIDQFKLSFSKAPAGTAYNLGTTLGGYGAIKNEDDTVTIRDTYNWTGQQDDPKGEARIPISDFFRLLPRIIKSPEGFGNVLMRSLFKDKSSPIEFTLPRRQTTTEMPESYRDGGRVRLI